MHSKMEKREGEGETEGVREGEKKAGGYLVEEGVKNPSAQRPSTTQIFSLVMSLTVWE